MIPFQTVTGIAVPYDAANVDTDQLVPARFLMKPRAYDYGKLLFHDLRFGPRSVPQFPLDSPVYKGARIMVTGANFGCGSAREQAAYALKDFGIVSVVGPSFGDIFRTNCVKNGILLAQVEADIAALLRASLHVLPGAMLTIDLERQTITQSDGSEIRFAISEADRDQLLSGKDDITRTLQHEDVILAFEREYIANNKWNPAAIARSGEAKQ